MFHFNTDSGNNSNQTNVLKTSTVNQTNLMKKTLLFLSIAAVSIFAVSCKKTNLEGVTILRGGGGSSGGEVLELPDFFKRNNGNGTCGGSAQIRAQYIICPTQLPTLDKVFSIGSGGTLIEIPGLTFGVGDVGPCSNNNGYISYCIFGGNIPPINKVVLQFTYPSGTVILLNSEGDPYII